MPSENGFGYANIDVGLFDDTKIKRLCRMLNDPDKINHAVVLYVSAILASWSEAEPTDVIDSAPLWTDAPDEIVGALRTVGLIDDDGRIPAESFDHWFGPARDRRSKAQAASAAAHAARYNSGRSAPAVRSQSDRTARPTVPTDSPNARTPATAGGGPARERTEGETLKAYMARIGATIPKIAETTDAETNGAEGRSNDHGESRPRTRRGRTKAV